MITWKCFIDVLKVSSRLKKGVFKTSLSQLQAIRFDVVHNVSSRSFNWTPLKRLYGAFKLSTFGIRLQLSFKIFGIAVSHIQPNTEYVWNTASIMSLSNGRTSPRARWVIAVWILALIRTLRWRHNDGDSVSNHQPHDCLLSCLFGPTSKKTSKLRVTGLCVGNSPGTGEFPAQMASNAENVSIWWRHHEIGHSHELWNVFTYENRKGYRYLWSILFMYHIMIQTSSL